MPSFCKFLLIPHELQVLRQHGVWSRLCPVHGAHLVSSVPFTLPSNQLWRLQTHPLNAERRSQGRSPANCLLLRGCGSRMRVPSFRERQGMRACVVAPTRIIAGLGMSLGMRSVDAPGATGVRCAEHLQGFTTLDFIDVC